MTDSVFLNSLLREERYDEALKALQQDQIPSIHPDFAYAYAVIYYRLGDFNQARISIEIILANPQSPYFQEAGLLAGFIHKELKDWVKAETIFLDFYLRYPGSGHRQEAGFLAALCREERDRYEEARELYQRLHEENPGSVIADEILLRWGFCLDKLEEWSVAREKYLAILTQHPGHTRRQEILFLIGMTFLKQNAFDSARQYFEEASRCETQQASFLHEVAKQLCQVAADRSVESKRITSKYNPYS